MVGRSYSDHADCGHAGMAATAKVQGAHSMTGTITMIDHSTGMLTLKTSEGDLNLHFPPATVQKLKEGGTITVHLSYSQSTVAH